MPASYLLKDSNGTTIATLPGVLDVVSLTGVATNVTSGTENQVTVASTTGLFPGMPVSIPNIPDGSFIHAIRSATVIELYRSAWNATTGVFTTSGANANATAATAPATDVVGRAHGFDPRCLVTQFYARGTWRNIHSSNSRSGQSGYSDSLEELMVGHQYGQGVAIIPTAGTYAAGALIMTAHTVATSDTLAATPIKRHNGEPWACRLVVHSGGHLSTVPADPDYTFHYNGPDA
jgi:hypothetical protein